jgi:hypothetical protein
VFGHVLEAEIATCASDFKCTIFSSYSILDRITDFAAAAADDDDIYKRI